MAGKSGYFSRTLSVAALFVLSLVFGLQKADAGTYNGPYFLQSGLGAVGPVADISTNENIRYQFRNTGFTGPSGWVKVEWDSWVVQAGGNDGAVGVNTLTDNVLLQEGRFKNSGDGDPSDLLFDSIDAGKTYVFNMVDDGTELFDSNVDGQVAWGFSEINHTMALVQVEGQTQLTTINGPNLILESGSTAEEAGSNEELWFLWTTNDFTDLNLVEFTDITNNTSLELSSISLGSTLKWQVMSSSDTDSGTLTGTTAGVRNFDAVAIEKSLPQSFIFLTGTQEIAVLGTDLSEITNGFIPLVPFGGNGPGFGSFNIGNGSAEHTFTVTNVGDGVLSLTGAPLVELFGSADFTVTAQPSESTLSQGDTTTFSITFDPTSAGTLTALVVIASNDDDEDPYVFGVRGFGYASQVFFVNDSNTVGDVFSVGAGSDINTGLSPAFPKRRIQDIIDEYILGPGDRVFIDTGIYSDELRLGADDFGSAATPLEFIGSTNITAGGSVLQYTGTAVVVDGTHDIAFGDLKIADSGKGMWINDSLVGLEDIIVYNNMAGVELSGAAMVFSENSVFASNGAWQVTVGATASNAIANCTLWGAGGLAYEGGASIMLSNSFVGGETASAIWSADAVDAPIGNYNAFWYPKGTAPFAELNGASFDTISDFQQTFDVFWDSTFADPKFNAPELCDFHVKSTAGRFDPAIGAFIADGMDSPLIDLGDPASPYTDETAPNGSRLNVGAFGGHVQASRAPAGMSLYALTFNDSGNAQDTQDLAWSPNGIATGETVDVSVSVDDGLTWTNVATAVAANESAILADMTIFPVSTQAWWRVILNSDTNVSDINNMNFNIGLNADPEIFVFGSNNMEIVSGENPTSPDKGTDFGGAWVANVSVDQVYSISNSGPGVLILQGTNPVTVLGDFDFSVQTQPAGLIGVGAVSTFTVRFHSLQDGPRTGVVMIANNDPDENPYEFAVSGTGFGTDYNGSLYLQSSVGMLGDVENPTTNGNIRYQWRKTEQNAAAGWLKLEWDSWGTQVGGNFAGVTSAPNDNVEVIGGTFKVAGDTTLTEPSNLDLESLETNKTYVFNIVDEGGVLAKSLTNDSIQIAVSEINHAMALVSLSNGVTTTISGSNVVLDTGSTAENAGSNEEVWFQWTTNGFVDVNFVTVADVTNNTAIELTLDAGSELFWLAITAAGTDMNTITTRTSGLLGFDVVSIEKSAVGSLTISFGGDTDGDGLDDAWEMDNFGDLDQDETTDFDNDGVLDIDEFLAGTNANDINDFLKVLTTGTVISDDSLVLVWNGATGHVYKVYCDDELPDSDGIFSNVFTGPGVGGEMAITNTFDAGGLRVYRVDAQKP